MKIAAVQLRTALLDREETTRRVVQRIHAAGDQGASLVVFPEACLPGYPVWLSRSGGAEFDAPGQKAIHARYVDQSVMPDHGHLESICAAAAIRGVEVVIGVVERAVDRGGHTLYCSALWIDAQGHLVNNHRKLVPTHEERLCWGNGDGAGLRTRRVGELRVGVLNCWENWMPLARTALQSDGMDVHILLWPGAKSLTRDLTRMVAREGRCFAISVGGVLAPGDLPTDLPELDAIRVGVETILLEGGSCVAGPDGEWIVDPDDLASGEETMVVVDLDSARIREERQNFDPAGHYARPDIFELVVDRRRQALTGFIDDETPNISRSGGPAVDRLDHLVLTVRDPDHAARFYRSVLGMDEVRTGDDERALGFGGQQIVLRTDEDPSGVQGSRATWGSADLCLVSRTPVERWVQHLKRYGLQIVQGPVDRHGATGPIRSVHFRDPDGNLIEIANPRPPGTPDVPAPPGGDPSLP